MRKEAGCCYRLPPWRESPDMRFAACTRKSSARSTATTRRSSRRSLRWERHSASATAARLDPANNKGLNVVPQLLTNDADRFAWAAGLLADMGYKEVNLNLGCPSGTVVAKEKNRPFAQPGQARGVSGQRARTLAFACLGQNARRNRERRRVRRAPCAVLPLRNR